MPLSGQQPAAGQSPEDAHLQRLPPRTRYQGSKWKLLDFIWQHLAGLEFHTALDAFGGTGSVSYLLKSRGKRVTYNDYLRANHLVGLALIENRRVRLSEKEVAFLLRRHPGVAYDDFIQRTFADTYYTDEENRWLDLVCQNIVRLRGRLKRAIAYYAVFQACIIKRPYNLFHRSNLYMRTAKVRRSFGNKAAWDKPFAEHFRHFVSVANSAVFDSGVPCRCFCREALRVPERYDLVYLDPPYISGRGNAVDYHDFYHFLEGMVDYPAWGRRINWQKKHLPLLGCRSAWSDPRRTRDAFRQLFRRFCDATLVISYRSDGIPSQQELMQDLRQFKQQVSMAVYGQYQYALSTNRRSKEILIVGK